MSCGKLELRPEGRQEDVSVECRLESYDSLSDSCFGEEVQLPDTDPDVIVGMERLRLLRASELTNVLEFQLDR